ncbi:protein SAR DEFICIENT 1-like [Olea europaea var. sylvestris]|uniref:SAR DEFICIENT 1 n=1 Tax=Olea europaea subsp. europaea TaxID=158383 RepID=A0A8S0RY07_OLEEU|nr:protein SAR DEFICIENT 1-like [Olea europaea var. sylvestris]CAA2984227.1 SAR DEFICIENT 1 [Olea europaea subsp. europaea]
MAAKRFFDEDEDQPNQKRMKNKPSLASVVREAGMVNFLEKFASTLEPVLRRVVSEEVENGLRLISCMRSISTSPSLKIQAADHEQTPSLQLIFNKRLSLPIFTGTKIVDIDNNPLQILLVDAKEGHPKIPTSLPYWIKVEIVVLDGDFNRPEFTWNKEDFDKKIVKERTGKRPLLTGELNITMRDGIAVVGDIEFTDNSSWIRCRKFRLGAKVVAQGNSQNIRICEAMSEPFVVKDHRGELYKKHHPPALEDEVWRLEKIGKDGTFHRKLSLKGIKTVQDFLKSFTIEPSKLREILGMSDKMWDVTLRHAKNCTLGSKLYRYCGPNYTLILNPICQIVKVEIDGRVYFAHDIKPMHTAYIANLIKDACTRWSSLEEVDEPALLTQGDMMLGHHPNEQQTATRSFMGHNQSLISDGSSIGDGSYDWVVNSGFLSLHSD